MPLNDLKIKQLKHQAKVQRLTDEHGLYLLVSAALAKKSKLWRFDYRFEGKRLTLSLRKYPEVSLAEAREKRDECRKLVAQGINPSDQRKAHHETIAKAQMTFDTLAWEWFHYQERHWSTTHTESIKLRLKNHLLPTLGALPLTAITPPQILQLLRTLENEGKTETALRIKSIAGQIFRYAVATYRCERDPTADLKGVIRAKKPTHFASIKNPKEIGGLLRAIETYEGDITVKIALQLLSLWFVRPGELRQAEWQEFALEEALWKIPAEKMKAKMMQEWTDLLENLKNQDGVTSS